MPFRSFDQVSYPSLVKCQIDKTAVAALHLILLKLKYIILIIILLS